MILQMWRHVFYNERIIHLNNCLHAHICPQRHAHLQTTAYIQILNNVLGNIIQNVRYKI